jgi:bacteriocin-like protein
MQAWRPGPKFEATEFLKIPGSLNPNDFVEKLANVVILPGSTPQPNPLLCLQAKGNTMNETTVPTLSPAFAQELRDLLLPSIASANNLNRQFIQGPMSKSLEFKPAAAMQSLGSILWNHIATGHLLLTTIVEGKTPSSAATLDKITIESLLDWVDAHAASDYEAVAALSGEDLVRPVEYAGITAPAANLLVSYGSMAAQFLGQYTVYLQFAASLAEAAAPSEELTEEELASVTGGTTYLMMAAGTSAKMNITGPITHSNVMAIQPPNTQDDLGSLFMTSSPKINAIMGDLAGAFLSMIPISDGAGAILLSSVESTTKATVKVLEIPKVVPWK